MPDEYKLGNCISCNKYVALKDNRCPECNDKNKDCIGNMFKDVFDFNIFGKEGEIK